MTTERVAWLFPGQGAAAEELLAAVRAVRSLSGVGDIDRQLRAVLGASPEEIAGENPNGLARNKVSSLIVTSLSLALMRHIASEEELAAYHEPVAVGGYSVGQWAALHAAGVVDEPTLLATVALRARRMDDATEPHACGMLGIVGIAEEVVEEICRKRREEGGGARISNYNSVGNLSVAGTIADLAAVEAAVAPLHPKVLARLPVAGAWHSPFLTAAAVQFRADLNALALSPPRIDTIDNTTGAWLPSEPVPLRDHLARQMCEPVRWYQGLCSMINAGVTTFLEIGTGNILSTFGMFLDRSVRHVPLSRLSRPLAATTRKS